MPSGSRAWVSALISTTGRVSGGLTARPILSPQIFRPWIVVPIVSILSAIRSLGSLATRESSFILTSSSVQNPPRLPEPNGGSDSMRKAPSGRVALSTRAAVGWGRPACSAAERRAALRPGSWSSTTRAAPSASSLAASPGHSRTSTYGLRTFTRSRSASIRRASVTRGVSVTRTSRGDAAAGSAMRTANPARNRARRRDME